MLVVLAVIVAATTACAGIEPGAPADDDASLFDVPSTPAEGTVSVPTYDGDGVETNMAGVEGVLSITPDGCTYLDTGSEETFRWLVRWPRDFGAVLDDPPRLVDGDGETMAVDGQTLGLAGGVVRRNNTPGEAGPESALWARATDRCPGADRLWGSNRVVTILDEAGRG
jgi:hypothetical protein